MAEPRAGLRAAFQTLFAEAPEGVALLDPGGSVIDANPALRRMAGEELRLGRPATGLLADVSSSTSSAEAAMGRSSSGTSSSTR